MRLRRRNPGSSHRSVRPLSLVAPDEPDLLWQFRPLVLIGKVVDGLLMPCGEPTGYLSSDQSLKNFVLSIEFRCAEEVNSGVYIRSPKETGGYEVQIWKQQPAGYNTGAIVGTAKTARDYTFKPNEWNRYEITADGDHIIVALNGETTLDIRDSRFSEGNIRLQYQQFPISFRNIKIRSLP